MVVKWTFYDSVTTDTYTFEINPKDGGSFPLKKKINFEVVTDPGGRTIAFEGRDEVRATQFSGTILTQDQYGAMETWFNKRYWITLTDDLGRVFTVYITAFDPKRRYTPSYPWRHDYTVDCFMLEVT